MLSKKINLKNKIYCIVKRIKSTKISIKITAVYAVMFILVLLILNASILFGVRNYLYGQANKQIDDVQTIIQNKITSETKTADLSSKTIFSDVPANENIIVMIITKDGKTLNSSGKFNYKLKDHHEDENKGKLNGKEKHIEDKGKHLIYKNVALQISQNNTVYLQIVKDMHNEYGFMKILFGVMAGADFVGVVVSIILGYIISKRMLKPIIYITKTAENISINNLNERIDEKGPDDELRRLSGTFNKMIDRLHGAFTRQAQFVSDASHELRTPVAVILGYANLLDRWGKNDKDALEKSIHGIKLESANMADLIEKLLFLAKGDSGTQFVDKKKFWLNELIDEVINESKLIEQSRKISSSKNDNVKILADYKMIKQMLRIFIDNSIKFTQADGTIDVSSVAYESVVKISVSDTGIGIPKEEIKNIFDRFYIVDKSRSKEKGGTGLGLSIAKWIVDMHKGTINVESEEGKGTKITVTIKADP